METEIKNINKEILARLVKLQAEINILKRKEKMLEKRQKKKFTLIDESMAEIWDNEEDEIWNEY